MNQIIKAISVFELILPAQEPTFEQITTAFREQHIEFNVIDCVNWQEYPDKPFVEFAIAYADDNIYVMYNVKEESIRAFYVKDAECKPFEDSCVEFFISMDASRVNYYNIESNCVGALQYKSGTDDFKSRVRHGDEVTRRIKRYSTLPCRELDVQKGEFEWSLLMVVPIDLLGLESGYKLAGHRAFANFYKCGDKLPQAQYLSWNPIYLDKPSFHQPKFFGELNFK